MSGQSTCQAIAEIREKGKTDRKALDVLGNTTSPITAIGNAVSAKNDSDNAVVSLLRNNFTSIQKTITDNKCKNITKVDQSNVYMSSPVCWTSMLEACKNPNGIGLDFKCLDKLKEFRGSPVSQENINSTSADCEINSAIEVLTQQEGNINNVAIIESIQKAKSLFSQNNSDNLNCSDISNNITNEQYIQTLLNCHNESAISQSNIISDCNPNLTSQINKNNSIQKCLIKSGIINKSSQSASVSNDSTIKNDQTADGLGGSLQSLIVIAVIIALAVVAGLVWKSKSNEATNVNVTSLTPI